MGLELAQRGGCCSLTFSEVRYLALRLLLLALQPRCEVGCPLLGAGGSLAQGRNLQLGGLLLACPRVFGVPARRLLVLNFLA